MLIRHYTNHKKYNKGFVKFMNDVLIFFGNQSVVR